MVHDPMEINIIWFASPWDIESNNFLNSYKLKYNKIASPMLTNLKLLKAVAKQKRFTLTWHLIKS